MKNPIKKILFSLFLIFSLAITAISASAVTTYTEFTGQSAINEGQSTTFDAVLYSMDPPTSYSIILYDSDLNPLNTFESTTTSSSLYESLDIAVNQSHYSTYGTYYIYLTATDSRGDSSYSQLTLTVNQYGWPTASITDPADNDNFIVGDTIMFSGYADDPNGNISSYNWTSDLNGLLNSGTGNFSSFSTSSLAVGTHTITFNVIDDEGKTDSDSITINVKQLVAPTASIVSPLNDQEFKENDTITFSGYGSDSDGTIVSYAWTSSIDGALSTSSQFTSSNLSTGTHTITFTVTDNNGLTDSDSVIINVKEVNAPVVSIILPNNEDDFKEGESITFTAVASDSDGTIASYAWISSIDGVIGSADTFSRSDLSNGRHTISVTVTDNDGLTAIYELDITVKAMTAPTAVITSPLTGSVFFEGDPITFDGSQSYDEDGYITAYSWRSDKDGVIGNLNVFTKTDLSQGKHYITLTVTDDDQIQYTDTFTIWIVINPLTAPTVVINSPSDGAVFRYDEQIIFDAGVSDDGAIASYSWTSDIAGEIKSGSGEPQNFTEILPVGEHEITLIITDDSGLTGQATVWMTVTQNQDPIADAGPDRTVAINSNVSFDGSNSYDSDGNIISYLWDFGDGTNATGAIAVHSFSNGTYTVTLTVTDNEGAAGTDTATIIADGRPTAVSGGPYSGYVNESITFDASQSTDDQTIVNYNWDFGDGSIDITPSSTTTYTYNSIGNYTVTLTVTDNDGQTHTDQTYAYISEKPADEEEMILKAVNIKSINLPSGEIVSAGDDIKMTLRFKNSGDIKLKDVKAKAVIQELGVSDTIGPFDIKKGKERTGTLDLEIPPYAKDGEYVIRLTISNNNVHRIVHRFVVVR